ncbi:hypothetical protein [Azotobacter vinelandii]
MVLAKFPAPPAGPKGSSLLVVPKIMVSIDGLRARKTAWLLLH